MFYNVLNNEKIAFTLKGTDIDNNDVIKSCVSTDGIVEVLDEEPSPIAFVGFHPDLSKKNATKLDYTVTKAKEYTGKRIKISNANYVTILYYVYVPEDKKWYLYKPVSSLSNQFHLLDEIRFMKYHEYRTYPLVINDEPPEIYNTPLNEHVVTPILKRMLKK